MTIDPRDYDLRELRETSDDDAAEESNADQEAEPEEPEPDPEPEPAATEDRDRGEAGGLMGTGRTEPDEGFQDRPGGPRERGRPATGASPTATTRSPAEDTADERRDTTPGLGSQESPGLGRQESGGIGPGSAGETLGVGRGQQRGRQEQPVGRELAMLQRTTRGMTRPYLEFVPDTYEAEMTIMDWLDPVVASAGLQGTIKAIGYYRSIGWVSDDAEETLGEYARLVAEPELQSQERKLDLEDHRRSLQYIARLATMAQ